MDAVVVVTQSELQSADSLIQTAVSSAKSSFAIVIRLNPEINTPSDIQSLLHTAYSKAYYFAATIQKHFLDISVIFEGWCEYDFWNSNHVDNHTLILYSDCLVSTSNINHLVFVKVAYNIIKDSVKMSFKYSHCAVGGTFDHLHIGHKIMLTMTAWMAKSKVTCGVFEFDSTSILKKSHYKEMQTIDTRISNVNLFLDRIRHGLTLNVVAINDPYGPTLHDTTLDAIVCSSETEKGCITINDMRIQSGMNPLDIYCIDIVSESKEGNNSIEGKLSSTYLRSLLAKQHATLK